MTVISLAEAARSRFVSANPLQIDGLQLPSTETNRRKVSLDVILSSLAKAINVYKTFTPEMDGNAIGGIMNLRTRSAYDSRVTFATHYAIGDYHQSGQLDTYRIANTAALGYRYETTPGGFAQRDRDDHDDDVTAQSRLSADRRDRVGLHGHGARFSAGAAGGAGRAAECHVSGH